MACSGQGPGTGTPPQLLLPCHPPKTPQLATHHPAAPLQLIVATGFIARSREGTATTLKRNGSDFSATIMGALLRCRHITIWTDVDGVYSADPRKVCARGAGALCWVGVGGGGEGNGIGGD